MFFDTRKKMRKGFGMKLLTPHKFRQIRLESPDLLLHCFSSGNLSAPSFYGFPYSSIAVIIIIIHALSCSLLCVINMRVLRNRKTVVPIVKNTPWIELDLSFLNYSVLYSLSFVVCHIWTVATDSCLFDFFTRRPSVGHFVLPHVWDTRRMPIISGQMSNDRL